MGRMADNFRDLEQELSEEIREYGGGEAAPPEHAQCPECPDGGDPLLECELDSMEYREAFYDDHSALENLFEDIDETDVMYYAVTCDRCLTTIMEHEEAENFFTEVRVSVLGGEE